jgi:hypothetical protein
MNEYRVGWAMNERQRVYERKEGSKNECCEIEVDDHEVPDDMPGADRKARARKGNSCDKRAMVVSGFSCLTT